MTRCELKSEHSLNCQLTDQLIYDIKTDDACFLTLTADICQKNHLISTASSLSQNYSGSCIFSPFALREDAEASLYYYDYKPRAAMVA